MMDGDVGLTSASARPKGTSQKNPDQVHANAVVRIRLVGNTGAGFDAAEAIQFELTRFARRFDSGQLLDTSSLARILALDRPAVGDSINAARPRIEALTEEAKATATLGESISGQGKVVPVSVSKEAKATRVSVLPSC
jgi:hypothetical protein